jgi:predicted RNA-binding Zn-ribbon protein involved in translation (DUF1610 family)
MGNIVITCPKTGKTISTGMSMDKASFESATLTDNSVQCPECGQMHVWNKKDAQVKGN